MVKDKLIGLLQEHSVRWGDFTLSSGATSDFYVDVRRTALHPQGSVAIANAVSNALIGTGVVALGGVELGAVSIVGSVISLNRAINFRPCDPDGPFLSGFIIRKKAKGHGTNAKIENCPPKGTKVTIIEDVTTTGGSLARAIHSAVEAGLDVVQAITVVDREEGAEEYLRKNNFQGAFIALVTKSDLAL